LHTYSKGAEYKEVKCLVLLGIAVGYTSHKPLYLSEGEAEMERIRTIKMIIGFKRFKQVSPMKFRLSRKDFEMLYRAIWKIGPYVRYTNPDSWRQYPT